MVTDLQCESYLDFRCPNYKWRVSKHGATWQINDFFLEAVGCRRDRIVEVGFILPIQPVHITI